MCGLLRYMEGEEGARRRTENVWFFFVLVIKYDLLCFFPLLPLFHFEGQGNFYFIFCEGHFKRNFTLCQIPYRLGKSDLKVDFFCGTLTQCWFIQRPLKDMIIAGSGTTRDEFGVTSPVLELLCSQRCDSPSWDPCRLHLPFPQNNTKKKKKSHNRVEQRLWWSGEE